MSRVGAYMPFGLGYEDIKEMAGIEPRFRTQKRKANDVKWLPILIL